MGVTGYEVDVFPLVVAITLLVSCWVAASARVYVKHSMLHKFTIDDKLLVLALLCITAMDGLEFKILYLGFGRHNAEVPAENIIYLSKLLFAAELLYIVVTVVLKLSIATLLYRLAFNRSSIRKVVSATAIIYTVAGVAFVVVQTFQCFPISLFWELSADPSQPRSCIPRDNFVVLVALNATISLISDGIFAVIPIFLIWNLRMDVRTKISVGFVLGLGLSTSIINFTRLFYMKAYGSYEDALFTYAPLGILSNAEVCIGLIAASLATLRPLLCKLGSRLNWTMVESDVIDQDGVRSPHGNESLPDWPDLKIRKVADVKITQIAIPDTSAKNGHSMHSRDQDVIECAPATKNSMWSFFSPTIGFNPDVLSDSERKPPVITGNPPWRPSLLAGESSMGLLETKPSPITITLTRPQRTLRGGSIFGLLKPTVGFNPDTISEQEMQPPVVLGNPKWRPFLTSHQEITPFPPCPPTSLQSGHDGIPTQSWWRRLLFLTPNHANDLSIAEQARSYSQTRPRAGSAQMRTITIIPPESARDGPPSLVAASDVKEWTDILISAQTRASAMAMSPSHSFSGDTLCENGLWDERHESVINLPKFRDIDI